MNRTEFLPRHLEYLLSFDVDLGQGRRQKASRADVITSHVSQLEASASPVYNALGDVRVMGETAITGHIACVQERVDFLAGQEYGEIGGRLVMRTADECLIEGVYSGVVRAGAHWHLLAGDYGSLAPEVPVLDAKAQITAHFETASTKYRWLVQHQCVGYGKMKLARGEPMWMSFDIYALGVEPEQSVWRGAP